MQIASHAAPVRFAASPALLSKPQVWAGRILSGLLVVFLAVDAIMKLIQEPHVIAASAQMGIKANTIVEIGAILGVCLVIYLIPRLALVGAVLLTGYLGGATATNLIVGQPLFACLFPVIVGALVWLSLYLRDDRVRALFAPRV
jgi:hypothetical protein